MITKDASSKILELFYNNPEKKFHIREIARLVGLSSTGVINSIKRLKEQRLLKSKKERTVELVETDFEGNFLPSKRAYNLLMIYKSGIIDALNEFYEQPRCIVLFGSYSDGRDTSESDIDIVVDTNIEKEMKTIKFEKILNRPIKLMTLNLEEAKPGFLNSLANGIVLSGFLKVHKNG